MKSQNEMHRPTVSILTPTYNHAAFIGKCLDSVLAQTYPHWEMVVIDDESSDGTPDVLARYDDPRIKKFRQKNRGVAGLIETYRFALQHTHGEIITILSGDDEWPEYRLEAQIGAFDDENVVACFGQGVLIDPDGREIARVPREPVEEVLNRPIGSVLRKLLVHQFLPSYTYLVRRATLDRIGGFQQPEGVLGVDSPTILRLAIEGEFRFVNRPLGYWRVHPTQHTGTHRYEQSRGDTMHALRFFRGLSDELKSHSGWTESELERFLAADLENTHFERGRRQLMAGHRRAALGSFWQAVRRGSMRTKAKALVGTACGLTGIDLEGFVKLTNRTPLR